jgi:hypothetical protein
VGFWAKQYRKEPGEYGSYVIEETGLCLGGDVQAVETGILTRFKLIPIPNAKGAVLKVLDGSNPTIIQVKPSTYDKSYQCVKVAGYVNPFAAAQPGGLFQGKTVLIFTIKYQTVGVA